MALAASMGAYGHGLELGEMSMSYANVKANPAAEDESPPVLSPSNPLAAYFGFEAGDDGSLLSPSPKANAFGEFQEQGLCIRPASVAGPPLEPSPPARAVEPARPQPNCTRCKLGRGNCRKWNQSGHLQDASRGGNGGSTAAANLGAAASSSNNGGGAKVRQAKKSTKHTNVPDDSIIGSRCSVEWQPDEVYEGVIRNVDKEGEGKVLVRYDDGEKQWESYGDVSLLPAPPAGGEGSGEKLIKSLQLAGASDEDLARAIAQAQSKRKSGRERKTVVHLEPPGTNGEPQFASSKPKLEVHVTCQACATLYSNRDLGMSAGEAADLGPWTCGVCKGTHERRNPLGAASVDPNAQHWRHSNAYQAKDYRKYKPIKGEQWSDSFPTTFVPAFVPEVVPMAGTEDVFDYKEPRGADAYGTDGSCILGGSWSTEEDEMLRRFCTTEGTGDWVGKAARFTAGDGRSASSLRQRWAKLKAKDVKRAAAGGGKPARPAAAPAPAVKTIKPKAAPAKDTKVKPSKQAANSTGGTKRPREEPASPEMLSAEKNCKTCRIGRGNCRHWNMEGHLQRSPGGFDEDSESEEDEGESSDDSGAANGGGSWSAAEDAMLTKMCEKEGTGDWVAKASRFTAGVGRSASSLRQRWAKLP